jgi:hypothetical protein
MVAPAFYLARLPLSVEFIHLVNLKTVIPGPACAGMTVFPLTGGLTLRHQGRKPVDTTKARIPSGWVFFQASSSGR